ncbi:hypothetical protein ACFS4T_04780 [Pseudomonas lini]
MPGLNDGQHYQLVDLYGEGLPGVLYSSGNAWYYREPMRAEGKKIAWLMISGAHYPLSLLPMLQKPMHQSLSDLTGNGRLDWVITRPGLYGFFSLKPDRNWSDFATFSQFPLEFFSALKGNWPI